MGLPDTDQEEGRQRNKEGALTDTSVPSERKIKAEEEEDEKLQKYQGLKEEV